ncbi:unnamed protein product [Caenorhabditis brenneri]
MSSTSTDDPGKPMKQSTNDLSEVMAQLSVTTDDSNGASPSLSDMPVDVVGLIIERSDYKEQLILRKTSKSLRALVDKRKPSCKLIKVEFFIQNIIITFTNHFVMYTDDEDMFICYDRVGDWIIGPTGMDQVALLEQWKQAEELELEDCFERFPLKHATHFKRFRIFESVIDPGTFDRIKNFLSELEDFEYCRIAHCGRDNIDDVQRMIGTPVPPNMSHYSIPDSDYCLEFSIDSYVKMSDVPIGDPERPMKQSFDDLTKTMAQLSVTAASSDNASKSPKNLSDMPFDVVGLIIERSSYKEQLKLRKVSKSLRVLIDRKTPACKSIQIECYTTNVNITFDDVFVMYTDNIDDLVADDGEKKVFVEEVDFKKAAFDDLASTLKNPKLRLEEFCTFEGVLEKISLSFDHKADDWRNDSIGMDQIALLEQWKQAEELELEDSFNRFPVKYATHFQRFQIREIVIDINTFDRIKDFLSNLDGFEYYRIAHSGRDNIKDYQNMTGIPVPPNMSHYSIPDSDYCLEFSIDSYDKTSDIPIGGPGKPMEQPDNNQSKAIKQHSATTDGSDKTSTPPKNLPDMPVDVVGLIIERSDYKQQLKLRKVSKSLRALVDKHKPACKSIKVKFRIPNITMIFDNHSVIYANREYKVDAYDFGIIVRSDDFKKNALDDLSSALQNPKLQLEEFGVLYYDHGKIAIEKETDNLHNVLESLNHQFLSELNDFEYCRIPFRQLDNIEHYQKITGIPIPPNMSHYSIADSDFCLEFTIAVDGITIVKKICHFH